LKKKNDASTKVGDRLWYSPIPCFKKYWHIIIIKHPEIFEKKKKEFLICSTIGIV